MPNLISLMKQSLKLVILLVTVILTMFWYLLAGEKVEGYKIKRQDLTRGVTVTGTVTALDNIELAPPVTARIIKLYVRGDEFVKKGQLLAVLDNYAANANVANAQAQVNEAKANLQNLITEPRVQQTAIAKSKINEHKAAIYTVEQTLHRTKLELKDALSIAKRYESLYKEGAVSYRDYEQARFKWLEIKENIDLAEGDIKQHQEMLKQAKEELSLTIAGTKPEQIQAAQARVEASAALFKIAQDNLNDYNIYAPIDGYVYKNNLTTGDIASPAAPVYILNSLNKLYLVSDVEESQLYNVHTGQKLLVIFDAYPDKIFINKIQIVYKQVDPDSGTFQTKSFLPSAKGLRLVPGMTYDATIITGEIKNALAIPSDYLVKEDSKEYVFVKSGTFVKKVKIKSKFFNSGRNLVTSGLKENDVIVRPLTNRKLKSGKKIRIMKFADQMVVNQEGR